MVTYDPDFRADKCYSLVASSAFAAVFHEASPIPIPLPLQKDSVPPAGMYIAWSSRCVSLLIFLEIVLAIYACSWNVDVEHLYHRLHGHIYSCLTGRGVN